MGNDNEAVRVGDRIILRDAKGKKLKGSRSTKGKEAPKAKKIKKNSSHQTVEAPLSAVDFYAKQREQFDYYNESNVPLDKAFAVAENIIKEKAIVGLRDIFVSVELAIDSESMKEFKALLGSKAHLPEQKKAYWKLILGITEMLLDYEGSFRNFMVHNVLASYRVEDGAENGNRLYGDFMIQKAKDERRVWEEKTHLLATMVAESDIDRAYREKLLSIATTEKVHDLVFLKENDDFAMYYPDNFPSKYKDGYDYTNGELKY